MTIYQHKTGVYIVTPLIVRFSAARDVRRRKESTLLHNYCATAIFIIDVIMVGRRSPQKPCFAHNPLTTRVGRAPPSRCSTKITVRLPTTESLGTNSGFFRYSETENK